ncbi:ABC transporter permease [Acholeplasma hippikon]|uniref:Oligopeptide transport system permease protein(OppB) n=1 Tax=Acholeplasma hippikon TaxID=264636 RepID=A0A449BLA5_9MOLU|nr:ABC transporter permease [Acholeplasma hippikon]VEU83167.1 oligopeptide transport system permease protein(OppB) [Acholeplasma hippikon]
MLRYFLTRLLWVFIVLMSILTITFVFLKIQPEYPPTKYDDKKAWLVRNWNDGYMTRLVIDIDYKPTPDSEPLTPAELKALQAQYEANPKLYTIYTDQDINKPIRVLWVFERVPVAKQYGEWLRNVFTKFDWGVSTKIQMNVDATTVLNRSFGYTIGINLLVILFQIPFGLFLGITAAMKKDKLFDNIVSVIIMVFISLPSFVVIMLLMKWFGSDLGWLPYTWAAKDMPLAQRMLSHVIPVASLSLGGIASLSRRVRAELADGLTQDFVLLARTKGLSKRQAIYRHALRISLTPILPGLMFSFVGLFGGAGITEQVYGIPGAGWVFLQATLGGQPDYNVIMYDTAFFGFIGLFTGILIDMSYGLVDPRIKMGASNG